MTSPRDQEERDLRMCVDVALGRVDTVATARDANIARLAGSVLRSRMPTESTALETGAQAFFSQDPASRLSAEQVVANRWVSSLPRLRDMLSRMIVLQAPRPNVVFDAERASSAAASGQASADRLPTFDDSLFRAMISVLKDMNSHLGLSAPLDLYLTGGMAVNLYTPTRVTTDIDLDFDARIALGREFMCEVDLGDGTTEVVYLDTSHNGAFSLEHKDSKIDALNVPGDPALLRQRVLLLEQNDGTVDAQDVPVDLGQLRLRVLSPLDLVVGKISRLEARDLVDIQALAAGGWVTATAVRARAQEALDGIVGNRLEIQRSIDHVVDLVEAWMPVGAPILPKVMPTVNVAEFVSRLAARHGVSAARTKLDDLAEVVTMLAGDEVQLDDVGQTLLALRERDLLTADQMNRLLLNHMREERRVQPIR